MNRSTILTTSDAVRVALRLFPPAAASDSVSHALLMVPGFAQHASTPTFTRLCSEIASSMGVSVLCLDPRGTGASRGRYHFGAEEYRDVSVALQYAKKNFRRVDLVGFSLGAYSSLRACVNELVRPEELPDHLFLVSCPTRVGDIIWRGSLLRHLVHLSLHPNLIDKDRDLFFRWGNPFWRLASAVEFAKAYQGAIHFLVGTADLLVPKAMSEQVFRASQSQSKSWAEFAQGQHAELMYFSDPERFRRWLTSYL